MNLESEKPDSKELSKETLILEKFIDKLQHLAEVKNQLGDSSLGITIMDAKNILQIMMRHCLSYNIGLPINLINYTLTVK